MSADRNARKRGGFLTRVFRDQRGNTIAMVGAALIPLTVMIGSGVDASRAYMVKTRLQQACDAGALAGRKAVSGSTYSADNQARALAFFNNNFPSGYQSTTGTTFTSTSPDGGKTVNGTATTVLPTAIMGLLAPKTGDSAEKKEAKLRVQAEQANRQQRKIVTETVKLPIYEVEQVPTGNVETVKVPIYQNLPNSTKTVKVPHYKTETKINGYKQVAVPVYSPASELRVKTKVPQYSVAGGKTVTKRVPVYVTEKVPTGKNQYINVPIYKTFVRQRDKTQRNAATKVIRVPVYRNIAYTENGKPKLRRELIQYKTITHNISKVESITKAGTRTYVEREIVGYQNVKQPEYIVKRTFKGYNDIKVTEGGKRTFTGYKEIERVDKVERKLLRYDTVSRPIQEVKRQFLGYTEKDIPVSGGRQLVGYKEITKPATTAKRVLKGYKTVTRPVAQEDSEKEASPILNKQSITLSVNCAAKFTISNSDIMLVLDTTGSMACPNNYNSTQCASYNTATESSTSRLRALKDSVKNFHTTLTNSAAGSTARIRYGIVPYSFTVNVGELLYDANQDWILGGNAGENATYQSRRAVYTYDYWTTPTLVGTETLAYVTTSQCSNNFAVNSNTTWRNNSNTTNNTWQPTASGFGYNYSGTGQNVTRGGVSTVRYTFSYNSWAAPNKSSDSTYRTCKRNVYSSTRMTGTTTDSTVPSATYSYYEYLPISWPVSTYVASIKSANPAVRIPSNVATTSTTSRWAGCIEERATTAAAPGSIAYNSLTDRITPTSATDLDIDTAPSSATTKWRPYYSDVTYYRTNSSGSSYTDATSQYGGKSQVACPYKAKLLSTMTAAEMSTYVESLSPTGGTHHDIGALWGARMLSTTGIFASNVTANPGNSGYVSRHMIFFTDGQLDTGPSGHSSYGVEIHDKRITGDGTSTQDARHVARFRAICDAVKARGVRIWVVTLGTDLNADLTYCASANSSFLSTNQTTLNNTFQQIAASIADLRLTE